MDKEIQSFMSLQGQDTEHKNFLEITPKETIFRKQAVAHVGQSLQPEGYPRTPASHWANAAPFSTWS